MPFDPKKCAAPLPRSFGWADGSAYVNHVALVRKSRGAEAYRVLSHPDLRPRYDLALAKGQLRLGGSEIPRVANVGVGAKSLDELCRTASAKRYATRADELISQGDLTGAKRELMLALREDSADGVNHELAERLDALDLALFAMGA